jgi:hypothetical protein
MKSIHKIIKSMKFWIVAIIISANPVFAQDPLTNWNQVYQSPVPITCMAYGNGTFVGMGGGLRFISHDGSNWMAYGSPPVLNQPGIAFGNGIFVAFGNSGANTTEVYQSTNGMTWSPAFTTSNQLFAAAYGNDTWVFVGTNDIYTSTATPLGTNEFPVSSFEFQPAFFPTGLAFANGNFIINSVLDGGDSIFTSSDGLTWQYQSTIQDSVAPPTQCITGIAYGNSTYVFDGAFVYDYGNVVLTSSNLVSWNIIGGYASGYFSYHPVVFFGGYFIASFGYGIGTSQDGNSWYFTFLNTNLISVLTIGQGTCVACVSNMVFQSGVISAPSNYPPANLEISTYPGIKINGTPGLTYQIEYSTDLNSSNWATLTNFSLPFSPYLWIDTSSPVSGQRFYRSVQLQ